MMVIRSVLFTAKWWYVLFRSIFWYCCYCISAQMLANLHSIPSASTLQFRPIVVILCSIFCKFVWLFRDQAKMMNSFLFWFNVSNKNFQVLWRAEHRLQSIRLYDRPRSSSGIKIVSFSTILMLYNILPLQFQLKYSLLKLKKYTIAISSRNGCNNPSWVLEFSLVVWFLCGVVLVPAILQTTWGLENLLLLLETDLFYSLLHVSLPYAVFWHW